mmetsp:Transcript_16222/g.38442  ORF Transcript_16222/g.38442 Transcript_16222/m.38442 type:complete len:227 (+) Transcript_16222:253-933(+)
MGRFAHRLPSSGGQTCKGDRGPERARRDADRPRRGSCGRDSEGKRGAHAGQEEAPQARPAKGPPQQAHRDPSPLDGLPWRLHVLQDEAREGRAWELLGLGAGGEGEGGGARPRSQGDMAEQRGHRGLRARHRVEPPAAPGGAGVGAAAGRADDDPRRDDEPALHPGAPRGGRRCASAPVRLCLPPCSGAERLQPSPQGHEQGVHGGGVQEGLRHPDRSRAGAAARD